MIGVVSDSRIRKIGAAKLVNDAVLVWESPQLPKKWDKVAAFDIDGTLVVPKSGARFPRGGWDYKFLPGVLEKLSELSKTHVIVLFTNQGAVKPEPTAKSFQNLDTRIRAIMAKTQCAAVYATPKSKRAEHFRKPARGMWDLFTKDKTVSLDDSFFVGDAAGRSKDIGDSDRGYADAVGVKFYTPEEIFHDATSYSKSDG